MAGQRNRPVHHLLQWGWGLRVDERCLRYRAIRRPHLVARIIRYGSLILRLNFHLTHGSSARQASSASITLPDMSIMKAPVILVPAQADWKERPSDALAYAARLSCRNRGTRTLLCDYRLLFRRSQLAGPAAGVSCSDLQEWASLGGRLSSILATKRPIQPPGGKEVVDPCSSGNTSSCPSI